MGSDQDDYFRKVKLEREKLKSDLMVFKESGLGYQSIFDEVKEVVKAYNIVKSSAAILDVTMGRAKVKVDAVKFSQRFKDSFQLKKHSWSIISDYCNLFKDIYRLKKGVSQVYCSEGAPVNLDLVVFALGELGQPSYTNLIGKV